MTLASASTPFLLAAVATVAGCSTSPAAPPPDAGGDASPDDASSSADADAETGRVYASAGGGSIPDGPGGCFGGGDCGCAGAPLVVPIDVPDDFKFTFVRVQLVGLEHTFVGHLRVELKHVETNKGIVFLGRTRLGPTTFNDCGDDSDVLGNYTFDDRSMPLNGWNETAGAPACGPTCVIPPGSYHPTPSALLTSFAGESSKGTWQLSATDMGLGVTGKIASWKITFE